jgi:hypothetical protein
VSTREPTRQGRPPSGPHGKARTVTVRLRLTTEEAALLAILAAQEGETVSEYIRRALDLQGR